MEERKWSLGIETTLLRRLLEKGKREKGHLPDAGQSQSLALDYVSANNLKGKDGKT